MEGYVIDGDLGCGAPDSREWYLCVIAQLPDKEIPGFIHKVFNIEVETRTQALEIINGKRT